MLHEYQGFGTGAGIMRKIEKVGPVLALVLFALLYLLEMF